MFAGLTGFLCITFGIGMIGYDTSKYSDVAQAIVFLAQTLWILTGFSFIVVSSIIDTHKVK